MKGLTVEFDFKQFHLFPIEDQGFGTWSIWFSGFDLQMTDDDGFLFKKPHVEFNLGNLKIWGSVVPAVDRPGF
jgi:hypothetical protein